jgi:hypothetical protein
METVNHRMRRRLRIRRTSGVAGANPRRAGRLGFVVVIVATAATVFGTSAIAKDASRLDCIKSTPPEIQQIGPNQVRLAFKYNDDCAFPAQSYIELRGERGAWNASHYEQTVRTGTYPIPTWRPREITIDGLRGGRYQVRSGVKYFGTDTSSAVDFTTQFQPARDLRAVVDGGSRSLFVTIRALTSPGGKNVPQIQYGRSDRFPSWTDSLESQPAECTDAGNGRERCKWIGQFLVQDQECLGCGHLERGVEYTFRVRYLNKVYVDAFGGQQTGTVTFRAGDRFRRELSEQGQRLPAGWTPPRAGSGRFAGIFAWGTGARDCDRIQSSTQLRFDCHAIRRNFAGSYVLIRFPSHEYKAHVALAPNQDRRRGLAWTEQTAEAGRLPHIANRGVILGDETVTLTGASVAHPTWDLGLDAYPFRSPGPRVVDVEITISPR